MDREDLRKFLDKYLFEQFGNLDAAVEELLPQITACIEKYEQKDDEAITHQCDKIAEKVARESWSDICEQRNAYEKFDPALVQAQFPSGGYFPYKFARGCEWYNVDDLPTKEWRFSFDLKYGEYFTLGCEIVIKQRHDRVNRRRGIVKIRGNPLTIKVDAHFRTKWPEKHFRFKKIAESIVDAMEDHTTFNGAYTTFNGPCRNSIVRQLMGRFCQPANCDSITAWAEIA